ncbi:hypothetical protein N656DRAFT_781957 [Canariomyces notabilis]|uniref:Uncharacterized protein n=1 Tax=Canariomyces notabilis TaxID=2074819 RepID=A0AAN6T9N7_9PEZI|nr:hypothetical protein N656DRAFT_781957 [Canariomyces arenarius]
MRSHTLPWTPVTVHFPALQLPVSRASEDMVGNPIASETSPWCALKTSGLLALSFVGKNQPAAVAGFDSFTNGNGTCLSSIS